MDSKPARIYEPLIVPAALDPDAVKICRRLKRYGHEAYLVGGCVRDLSLGHIPKDFDVATSARPRQIKRLFRNARIIGRRFKLVHVQFGDKIIEVSTFRKNPSVDADTALESAEVEAEATDEAFQPFDEETGAESPREGSEVRARRGPPHARRDEPLDSESGADDSTDDEPSLATPDRDEPLDDDSEPDEATTDEPEGDDTAPGDVEERSRGADRRPGDRGADASRRDRPADRDPRHRDEPRRDFEQRGERGRRGHEGGWRGRDAGPESRPRFHDRHDRGDVPREPRRDEQNDRGRRERGDARRDPRHDVRRDDRRDDRDRPRPDHRDPYRERGRDEPRSDRGGAQERRHAGPSRHDERRPDRDRGFDRADRDRGPDRGRGPDRERGFDRADRDRGPDRDRGRDRDRGWDAARGSDRDRDRRPDRMPHRDDRDRGPRDEGRARDAESHSRRPGDDRGPRDRRYRDDDRAGGREDASFRDRGDADRGSDPDFEPQFERGSRHRPDETRYRPAGDDDRSGNRREPDPMNREFADRDEDEETDLPEDGDEVTDSDAGESGPRDDSGFDHRSRRRGGRGRRRRGGRGHGGASRAQRSRRDRIHRDPHDDERGDAPREDRDVDAGRSDSRGEEHDDLDREPAARGAADDDAGDAGFPRGEGGDPTAEDPLDDPADDDGSDSDDFGDGAGDLLIRRDNVFGTAEEDAVRRDFTINALFYDVDENVVIDYVGGADDLARRVIRTIGDPEIRFQEDPVRILRAIKFAARLGFTFDEATYAALVKYRGDLRKCAPPRLTEELLKILACGAAARAFELMRSTGVLETILPEIHDYIERDPEPTALRAEGAEGDQGSSGDRDFAEDSEGRDDSLAEDGDEESGGDEDSEPTSEEAGETAPESREGESGTTRRLSAADQIRRYLEVIDEADRGRRVFGNATLFCALLLGPIKEAISQPGGPRDPGMAADKVMRPFAQRMAISRRDAFRVKQIVVALPRFRRPKNSRRRRRVKPIDLVKRDYFKDALDFYRIECAVRGTHDDAEIRRWLDLYYGWLRNANPREWRRARTEAPFDDFGRSAERRPSGPASDRPSSGAAGGPEGGARDEARDDREPGPGQDDREGGGRRRRRRGRGRNRDRDRGFGPEPGAEGAPELESSEGDEVSEAELASGDADRPERGDDRGEGHGDARGRRRRRGRGRGRGDGEESGRPAGEIAPEEAAAQEPEEDDPIVEIDWNAPFPTVDDPGPISMIRTGVDQTEKRGRRRRRRLDGAARELSKEVEDQPALQALKMIEGDPRGHEATRPRKNKRKDDDRSRTDRDPPFDFVADFESIEDVFRW